MHTGKEPKSRQLSSALGLGSMHLALSGTSALVKFSRHSKEAQRLTSTEKYDLEPKIDRTKMGTSTIEEDEIRSTHDSSTDTVTAY